jgi:threonine dehydrogenase-like Zn-dependent dehydrogenase
MRACVFKAPNAPLEVVDVPDPIAGPGELVVRVRACGICSSDLHAARSATDPLPAGAIMGHELAGEIAQIGPGVNGYEIGEPVVVMSYLACGECANCRAGAGVRCADSRLVGFGEAPGGYAELIATRPASVFKMPRGMSFKAGATVEPLVIGLHAVRRAKIRTGESCAIIGAGATGLMTMLCAREAGARPIVFSDRALDRRESALRLGADAAVDPRMHHAGAAMAKLTGAPPDVVFDCAGEPGTLAEAISVVRPRGRVIAASASMEDDGFPPGLAMGKELDIRFSFGLEPGEVEETIEMLASGRISTAPLITHAISLDDLPRAFAALQQPNRQVRVIVEP